MGMVRMPVECRAASYEMSRLSRQHPTHQPMVSVLGRLANRELYKTGPGGRLEQCRSSAIYPEIWRVGYGRSDRRARDYALNLSGIGSARSLS